ncbi:hypothetical protein HU200_038462 [Digitaria exilis]|uniref:Uncharacterized protein n=1 Tax=Digitaria exilis TaxID=1010633 RepID=A0A835BCR8_9POAL|nr:hypothetical protein HU200_038462 [Digitaria exilis]
MAHAFKLLILAAFLFISLLGSNGERCGTSSIQVQTINTGVAAAGGDTVFEVEVKNLCSCSVRNVRLDGGGFATSMYVDPALFRADDGAYLVNGGEPVAAMAEVTFRYAWDHFFQMTPRSLEVDGQC